ncbi:lipid-A-disaccharide synthase N-terminal domain-containing protein [Roseibacillus persicicus]|uniref:lipid-A-disaccharide synthase N-terminal domain-containing protein n=1 Tax=Roseibacillus persicicus TaxID=454148 RepID=UPI00280D7B2C|nr:lipid-A-disaccharide synthase N-terminal domain-containing protein [Roseibacillus persicicus]MDQ8189888.1 lipid-A-disaccharide synthase N-terminal domain-containing protein [Roseibacillus persicicus]
MFNPLMFDLLILAHEVADLPDGDGWMHSPFFEGSLFGQEFVLYPWKIIGYFGVTMFAGRWFPQLIASKKAKQVKMPRIFWIMSVLGSISLLTYFTFGKTDSVGVLANLFPSFVGLYNLILDLKTGPAPKE